MEMSKERQARWGNMKIQSDFESVRQKNLLNLDDYEFIEKVSIALKARDIFGQQMGTN